MSSELLSGFRRKDGRPMNGRNLLWLAGAGLLLALVAGVVALGPNRSAAQDTCVLYDSTDTDPPLAIPQTSPLLVSTINVPIADSFTLTDVNISPIDITHSYVNDLDAHLISPNNTDVELFSNAGNPPGSSDFIDTVLDDASPDSIQNGTAPFTGIYHPKGSLDS